MNKKQIENYLQEGLNCSQTFIKDTIYQKKQQVKSHSLLKAGSFEEKPAARSLELIWCWA